MKIALFFTAAAFAKKIRETQMIGKYFLEKFLKVNLQIIRNKAKLVV